MIIFAEIYKDRQGWCHVIDDDMRDDYVCQGIGELFNQLNGGSPSGPYHMIGRSCLMHEDNIVCICPCKKKLIIAGNDLTKSHIVISDNLGCSDDLYRRLDNEIRAKDDCR